MVVSTTMRDGVDELRILGAANHNDVFAGTYFWTDDQLLEILQKHLVMQDIYLYAIIPDLFLKYRYNLPQHYYVDTSTAVYDGTLIVATIDKTQRIVTFASALTSTTAVLLNMYTYDLNKAAAQLWDKKASQRYDAIAMKAGANQMQLQQEYEHCVQRANYYRSLAARRIPRKKGWQ